MALTACPGATGSRKQMSPKRLGGELIRSRRAAEAQVDPAGEEGRQGAELFGDHERGVVGQHDTARADAD